MTTHHAPTQLSDEETVRLLLAAAADPECRGTLRLVRAKEARRPRGTPDGMLGHWTVQTPDGGQLHRIALVRVLDGEAMGFDENYRDEQDALDVFDHLAEEIDDPTEPEPEPEPEPAA